MNKKNYLFKIGLLHIILSIISIFLVNHFNKTVIILLILNLIYINYLNNNNDNKLKYILLILSLITGFIYLILPKYQLLILFQSINTIIGIIDVIMYFINNKILTKTKYIVLLLISTLLIISNIFLIYTNFNPNIFITIIKNISMNNISIKPTKTSVFEKYYYVTNDIKYSNKYPNSYIDIYNNKKGFEETKPIFIYIHGGGWAHGDKSIGNSSIKDNNGYYNMIKRMLDEDFIVISMNYALTPDYNYPTPIYQLDELIKYLKNNKETYKIETNFIILGGSSAGAHMASQYTLIQTNNDYAKIMNMRQILVNKEIKGLYLGCGLYEPAKVTDTNFFPMNYMLYHLVRGYFNTNDLNNKIVNSANILKYINSNYPKTYITDGNLATFNKQAHELEKVLSLNKVEYTSYILDYSITKKLVFHSYDLTNNTYSNVNIDKFIEFINKIKLNNNY